MPTLRGKQEVYLGPFTGGLNLRDALVSTLMADDQAPWIKNLDPYEHGLKARQGFNRNTNNWNNLMTAPVLRLDFLGQYTSGSDLWAVIGKVTTSGNTTIYKMNFPSSLNVINCVARVGEFCAVVEYNNLFYHVPRHNIIGGTTYITNDTFTGGTTTTNVPQGHLAFIWKDRLWVVEKDLGKVSWSKATDPTVFAAPDGGFFLLGGSSGGDPITDVVIQDDLMLIFQRDSYYQFNYDVDPAEDGTLREMSNTLGAFATVQYEDQLYLANTRGVFRFVQGNLENIGEQLEWDTSGALRLISLSIHNNMLIAGFTNAKVDVNFDVWAMNLKTGAWTGYDFGQGGPQLNGNLAPVGKAIQVSAGTGIVTLWGDSRTAITYSWWEDKLDTDENYFPDDLRALNDWASPEYSLITKSYDLDAPTALKKVFALKLEGYSSLPDADADFDVILGIDRQYFRDILDVGYGIDFEAQIDTATQDVQPKYLSIPAFRCRSFAIRLVKPFASFATYPGQWGFEIYRLSASVSNKTREITRV